MGSGKGQPRWLAIDQANVPFASPSPSPFPSIWMLIPQVYCLAYRPLHFSLGSKLVAMANTR